MEKNLSPKKKTPDSRQLIEKAQDMEPQDLALLLRQLMKGNSGEGTGKAPKK